MNTNLAITYIRKNNNKHIVIKQKEDDKINVITLDLTNLNMTHTNALTNALNKLTEIQFDD